MSLEGQRVVVIGGSSGIGFAVAKAALADGASVTVGSSNPQNVEAAVGRLGAGAAGQAVDVKTDTDVATFFERVGRLDHLVFTAGDWGGRGARSIGDTNFADAQRLFDVWFWGALTAARLPRERAGHARRERGRARSAERRHRPAPRPVDSRRSHLRVAQYGAEALIHDLHVVEGEGAADAAGQDIGLGGRLVQHLCAMHLLFARGERGASGDEDQRADPQERDPSPRL